MRVVTDIIVISFTLFICLFMFCGGHTENIATVLFSSSLASRFALAMSHCSLFDIFPCCHLQSKYLI